jgi:hypothetical protein
MILDPHQHAVDVSLIAWAGLGLLRVVPELTAVAALVLIVLRIIIALRELGWIKRGGR